LSGRRPSNSQLRELAQLRQQRLQLVKILLRCVPHVSSITLDVRAAQEAGNPACDPRAITRGASESQIGSDGYLRPPTADERDSVSQIRAVQVCCGQGRGRTADLPLFRRTLVPTELPDLGDVALGATSAVPTGFEPATSTLTGWRALRTALQDHHYRRLYPTMLPEGMTYEVTPCARKSISPEGSWSSRASGRPRAVHAGRRGMPCGRAPA
jgi:hypothetical protein